MNIAPSTSVADLCATLQALAPLELSEPWDNTGLLLGDRRQAVQRVMTCLTLTPASAAEAVAERAELVIAHHPLPFKPLAKITTDGYTGSLLWTLAKAGVSVYSSHTAWDSAARGINARLAELLDLQNCRPLIPAEPARSDGAGAGRVGELSHAIRLSALAKRLAGQVPGSRPQVVVADAANRGSIRDDSAVADPWVASVAIGCGSGGGFLAAAIRQRCQLLLTGEATFHTCLEAQAAGVSLLLIGHFASERFAMEELSQELSQLHPSVYFWASRAERDPVSQLPA